MKFSIAAMTMCFFVLVSPYQAFGDVVLMPSADGHAQSSGANGITVDDTQTTIATFRSGGNNIRNGILEFDLSPYSAGTVVESATLEFELTAALTNPVSTTLDLKVGQYIGNLVVDTGDFEDFGNFTGDIVTFDRTTNGGPGVGDVISINLNPLVIQSIIDDPSLDSLGIRTATQSFANIQFLSNEGAALNGGLAPTLTLSVPEPGSLAVVAFGGVGLLVRRRRHARI